MSSSTSSGNSGAGDSGKKPGRIFFGSLEATEALKRQTGDAAASSSHASSPSQGKTLDDLKSDSSMDLEGSSKRARDEHMETLEVFERRKRAREAVVPTDDKRVRAKLREMGEPQCLFGEDAMDRRTRLRELMAIKAGEVGAEAGDEEMKSGDEGADEEAESDDEDEEVYTPGTEELLQARRNIARYSLPRARDRVARQTEENKVSLAVFRSMRAELYESLRTYTNYSSQIGDDRPLSQCRFSPNSHLLATGSFGGLCKIWSIPDSTLVHTLRGHTDKIGGITWHPQATISQERGALNLASGGGEGTVNLWSLESDVPLATMTGHTSRVTRMAFHPMGQYLGTTGFDGTWRLWDVEARKELLTQRGHSREVYSIAFQCDGSLAATGGLDAIGRVWDLRSGRSALTMEGHMGDILGIDFAPNGHQMATASADNSIRIWDLRLLQSIHSIPAHTNLVSSVKFFQGDVSLPAEADDHNTDGPKKMEVDDDASHDEPSSHHKPSKNGLYLASSSFDGTVKLWSSDDWKLQKALVGHTGKVMDVDIANDGRFVASAGYDRTFKLWAPETADY
ncbi:U4/U6 small nuclear ribonucleoprotein Prp4 [Actinomortierella ambigua]|uniref:U4/U6 small nuclear ribonucleoprotein Prp4 n=1 Tax=Actinomortierella ambigua TaxID=1343610 RepID=A0A9P6QAF8_9FUNG|nr:U4/U6 small nuclear ribonucleoprotein Prp4 [Actinomortierella ambigua]